MVTRRRSADPAAIDTGQVHEDVLAAIGNTPIVKLHRVARGVAATLLAKLEFMNPGGSVKDRIGFAMIEDAERRGQLRPGGTIIEATSGNTGVGLAMAAAVKGYQAIFVMPDKMSEEKIRLLRAFGAKVVITPTAVAPDDPRSYYQVARRLAEETPDACYPNQYANPANPDAHYHATGPEIWRQMAGRIDVLVAGMGTGGTISGVGRYLKEMNPAIAVVGVDPIGSIYSDYFREGRLTEAFAYQVEGIGEDFLPSTMDFRFLDAVVPVGDRESFLMTRRLVREEGIFCGGSSGTAVAGAISYAHDLPAGTNVVIILPDSGSRYLSKIFSDDWMRENLFLQTETDLGRVGDIIRHGRGPLVAAAKADRVSDVIAKMKQHGISQVPVLDGSQLLGLITEVDLLEYLLGGEHRLDHPIADIITASVPIVAPDTSLSELTGIFRGGGVAVVVDRGQVRDLVTKIDLIEFLAGRRR